MNSIADELKKLQELVDAGTLSEKEFAHAKWKLLEVGGTGKTGAVSDQQLAELQLQNELLRVDQEWLYEREHHKVSYGKHSVPTEPNASGAVLTVFVGIFAIGFGVFWVSKTLQLRGIPEVFPLFGVVIICFGIGVPIYHLIKYLSYQSAYDEHQRRRSEILRKIEQTQSPNKKQNK